MKRVGIAILLDRKTSIPEKAVSVQSRWWRVPVSETPECQSEREYMTKIIGRDPLSQKSIILFKLNGTAKVKNRAGQNISLASCDYPDSISRDMLVQAHLVVVEAIKLGEYDLTNLNADNYLKSFIRSFIVNHGTLSDKGPGEPDQCPLERT
jgi:hypothetical protein